MKEENNDNRICLSLKRDLFDKVLSGEVKTIHKEASDYWKRIFLMGKGLTAKALLLENGRQKTRKSFIVEFKSIQIETFNGKAYFALTLGKILLDYSTKRKKKTVKKIITKPVHGQKLNLSTYTNQVHKCITDIREGVRLLKLQDLSQSEAEQERFIVIRKYCDQYNLNYLNINTIYNGSTKA